MATWDRRVPDIGDRFEGAAARGLFAAAYVYYDEIKRRLAGGYTTGAWVTGQLLNSIAIQPPALEGGDLVARVGTPVRYALYWELGHNNVFTRRFERQERWFPAAIDTQPEQQAAFVRAFTDGLTAPTLRSDLEFTAGPAPIGPAFPPGTPSNPLGRTRTRRR
jgi:hypothetical protein